MRRITRPAYLAVLFLPVIFVAGDGRAAGNLLRVPQDYATIQAAIDAAVTGDTVLVSRGTYAGGLVIAGKTITLASDFIHTRDYADVSLTIVSGGNPVITIESTAGDTTVQGITFQNGSYGLSNYASRMYILDNHFINTGDAVSFETAGGVCRGNTFDDSSDDAIDSDHSNADITIENNTILNSGDDGIEIRLHSYAGPMIQLVIRNNHISGSREDGIQLIDYPGLSSRLFRIERNVIVNSAMVGIGSMPDGNTVENFNGAPMVEEVQVVNNTLSGNPYGITGGDNMLVMNNIIANGTQIGLKRVKTSSLATHNDFWNNGTAYTDSNVDTGTTLSQDPLLDANYDLQAGSPCIDAGAASVMWNGKIVDAPPYSGPAPDLGGRETSGGPTPPTVTVAASDPWAAELGQDPGVFTVSRTGDTTDPLTVVYSLRGAAENGTDYVLPESVTIPAGASSETVVVTPIDDSLEEGNETVVLTVSSDPAYLVGNPSSETVTIADDDLMVPTVTVLATDASAAEAGADPGVFTVSRTGDTSAALTVVYAIGGDAANGVDYQTIETSVAIPAGASSATVTITPIDDPIVDDEEVVLTIASDPSYQVGVPGTATVTITDDDIPIFADGFESGGFLAWSASTTDGGDLSVGAPSAIEGTYGMQAVLDDNNSIYLTDNTPNAETRYRCRFYFDPNSIPMASGDVHYILRALAGSSTVVLQLEFRSFQGDYQIRGMLLRNSGSKTTAWFPLLDQMHFLELDWRAATAAGANNGGLTLWIDGEEKANLTGIDNDTRRVDSVRLGAVSSVDSGTRGTTYFDAFESRRDTYIGPAPGAPPPPPPPPLPEVIFADGFESGNLSAWSTSKTDGGDLSASMAAAIEGAYGMQAVLDDNNSIYVTDWRPFAERRYRAGFHFDLNGITMASGNAHDIFYGYMRESTAIARLELRFYQGNYQLRAHVVNDAGKWISGAWTTISDAPHLLEMDWRAATAPGANDGGLALWIDGQLRYDLPGVDNDTRVLDLVRLGAVSGVDSGTRGTYYFDAFESRRQP